MYIYASLYGEIRRFSTISWIEWLKKWKESGVMPKNVDHYSKHAGHLELSDMASWGLGDLNLAMDNIAERRKKKRKINGD